MEQDDLRGSRPRSVGSQGDASDLTPTLVSEASRV